MNFASGAPGGRAAATTAVLRAARVVHRRAGAGDARRGPASGSGPGLVVRPSHRGVTACRLQAGGEPRTPPSGRRQLLSGSSPSPPCRGTPMSLSADAPPLRALRPSRRFLRTIAAAVSGAAERDTDDRARARTLKLFAPSSLAPKAAIPGDERKPARDTPACPQPQTQYCSELDGGPTRTTQLARHARLRKHGRGAGSEGTGRDAPIAGPAVGLACAARPRMAAGTIRGAHLAQCTPTAGVWPCDGRARHVRPSCRRRAW